MEAKIDLEGTELLNELVNDCSLLVSQADDNFFLSITKVNERTGNIIYKGEMLLNHKGALYLAHSIIKMAELNNHQK